MSVLALCLVAVGTSARNHSALQPVSHFAELRIDYTGRSYHHIGGVRPKPDMLCRLPEPSLRTIAPHRVTDALSRDHTQFRLGVFASGLENDDPPGALARP